MATTQAVPAEQTTRPRKRESAKPDPAPAPQASKKRAPTLYDVYEEREAILLPPGGRPEGMSDNDYLALLTKAAATPETVRLLVEADVEAKGQIPAIRAAADRLPEERRYGSFVAILSRENPDAKKRKKKVEVTDEWE